MRKKSDDITRTNAARNAFTQDSDYKIPFSSLALVSNYITFENTFQCIKNEARSEVSSFCNIRNKMYLKSSSFVTLYYGLRRFECRCNYCTFDVIN